jgi:DNA-binding FadR family transcriptional regulator
MGLIEISRGAPARAARPTAESLVSDLHGAARHFLSTGDGVRHFQHARLLFEGALAREVALHGDEAGVARLAEALEANRLSIGNQSRFVESDLDFHFALATATGNPIFPTLIHALAEWLGKQRAISAEGGAQQSEVYAQHAAIYAAIAAHDAVAAQQAMEAHLDKVARQYWRAIDARPRAGRTSPDDN